MNRGLPSPTVLAPRRPAADRLLRAQSPHPFAKPLGQPRGQATPGWLRSHPPA